MHPRALEAFKAHAAAEFPREACGLLVGVDGREQFLPCRNIASKPTDTFILDPQDYLRARQTSHVLAICHTHPNRSACPSEADLSACEASGLPWFILSWPVGELRRIEPKGYQAPLIGRPFVHGVHDCYSLIRDYYRQVLHIELPDFDREEHWWEKGFNLYVENFEKAGFVRVSELRPNDVVLMQIRAKVVNHGGVYLGPGYQEGLLHHLYGQLSGRVPFGGYWRRHMTHILRHRDLA